MLWALLLAFAAAVQIDPPQPKQGDAIRVTGPREAASARLGTKSIRLFAQPDGTKFGLMPVSAIQKPGAYDLVVSKEDGGAIETMRVIVSDAHFPKQNVKLPPRVQRLKPSPREMETVTAFRDTVTAERRWSEPFDLPIPGCLTSPFGVRRWYNGKPSGNYHAGIDQASPAGTPIHAIAGGVVRLVREFNIHGHVVGVDHGQGLSSIYLHMSKFAVAEGAQVQKGDVIGYVGSTGRSTAPHLHWSLYANGMSINPTKWITPPACRPTAPTPPAKSPTSSKK